MWNREKNKCCVYERGTDGAIYRIFRGEGSESYTQTSPTPKHIRTTSVHATPPSLTVFNIMVIICIFGSHICSLSLKQRIQHLLQERHQGAYTNEVCNFLDFQPPPLTLTGVLSHFLSIVVTFTHTRPIPPLFAGDILERPFR